MRPLLRLLPLFLVLAVLPGPARATGSQPAAEPPETAAMVAAYRKTFPDLPADKARAAVLGQDARVRLVERIGQTAARDGFGGAWFEPESGLLHVHVTAGGGAAVSSLAGAFGVPVALHPARWSYADLERRAAAINAGLSVADRAADAWATPEARNNRVALSISDPARAGLARERFAADPAVVVKEFPGRSRPEACYDRWNCGAPARSGINLGLDTDGPGPGQANRYGCSLGFTAKALDGSRWAVTAGHCSKGLANICPDTYGCWGHGAQYIGPMRQAWDQGNVDVARIRRDNPYWTTGGYMYNVAAPNSPVDVDDHITYRPSIMVNDTVCLSSKHSYVGMSCGVITSTASDRGLVEVDFDACDGDSGGGWYRVGSSGFRYAYGIHRGGRYESCHADDISLFTTVPDIYGFWDWKSPGAEIRFETR